MDPDFRDLLRKNDEDRSKRQLVCTHEFGHGEACILCELPNPNPRVVLVLDNLRAVYKPKENKIVVEARTSDALGAERWDCKFEFRRPTDPNLDIDQMKFDLIVRGKRP